MITCIILTRSTVVFYKFLNFFNGSRRVHGTSVTELLLLQLLARSATGAIARRYVIFRILLILEARALGNKEVALIVARPHARARRISPKQSPRRFI